MISVHDHHRNRRRRLLGASLALALAHVACDDDPMQAEEEPEVATMRLTVGTQTIDVADNGVVTGGPIAIPVGSTAISVEWLLADGSPADDVDGVEFQLDVQTDNAAIVTFTRTGPFVGTLVGVTPGSTTVEMGLLHVLEGHHDFGPFVVPVTVS
jgi:hypothetical protein